LVFAADFNDLDMALRVLHAVRRAESVTLTMPWMGSKSDGSAGKPHGRAAYGCATRSRISQCQRGIPLAFTLGLLECFGGQGSVRRHWRGNGS
jgi:hypothetical protein